MTEAQFEQVSNFLKNFISDSFTTLHHGQCIGSDCEAAEVAYELGFTIIAHPGYLPKNPSWKGSRGSFDKNHTTFPEKPFLVRDQDIVDASEILIATPAQKNEVLRSGTWATIRYGEKSKPVIIIFPDGECEVRGKSLCKK